MMTCRHCHDYPAEDGEPCKVCRDEGHSPNPFFFCSLCERRREAAWFAVQEAISRRIAAEVEARILGGTVPEPPQV